MFILNKTLCYMKNNEILKNCEFLNYRILLSGKCFNVSF